MENLVLKHLRAYKVVHLAMRLFWLSMILYFRFEADPPRRWVAAGLVAAMIVLDTLFPKVLLMAKIEQKDGEGHLDPPASQRTRRRVLVTEIGLLLIVLFV